MVEVVNLGGDADTNGTITGGLAEIYWSYEIPRRWLAKFSAEQVEKSNKAAEDTVKIFTNS